MKHFLQIVPTVRQLTWIQELFQDQSVSEGMVLILKSLDILPTLCISGRELLLFYYQPWQLPGTNQHHGEKWLLGDIISHTPI